MHAPSKTAVGGSDHPLTPHHAGKSQDALGHKLGMFDHVGGVADDARQDQLLVWQLHLLPYPPFVLMPHVASLKRIGLTLNRQHHINDVAHGYVGRVRTMPATPAEMEADAIPGHALDGMVERLDAPHGEFAVFLHRRLGIDHVPILGDGWIIELQYEAGTDNGLVFLAHGIGTGKEKLLLVPVVLVANAR